MEIVLLTTALTMGFVSGFHCIGMCGPIALSLGLTGKSAARFYIQNLAYQFGRIFTYSLLGGVVGIVGQSFQLAGLQQPLTIFAGIMLILMAIFSFKSADFSSKLPFLSKFLLKVKISLGKLMQRADIKSRFATGILNGLLPCGMVYMALTASLAYGGIVKSSVFMFFFGLGTLPFMFVAALAGNLMTQAFRVKILKIVPFAMILLGSLLIIRGTGIPVKYISPASESLQIHQNTYTVPGKANCCE